VSPGDIVLLLVLAGAFIIGFVWGTIRSLFFLVGAGVVFVLAAHARPPLSSFLGREWSTLATVYSDMLALLILYVIGLVVVTAIVVVGGRNTGISGRWPGLDRVAGGLIGVAAALLVVAGIEAILGLFYGYPPSYARPGDAEWSATALQALLGSQIGGAIHRSFLPPIGELIAPILPVGLADAFGAGLAGG
jgi:hypothetical protein